jgi:hypothetical protein
MLSEHSVELSRKLSTIDPMLKLETFDGSSVGVLLDRKHPCLKRRLKFGFELCIGPQLAIGQGRSTAARI